MNFKTDQFGCLEFGCQLVALDEIVIGMENSVNVIPNPVASFVISNGAWPIHFKLKKIWATPYL